MRMKKNTDLLKITQAIMNIYIRRGEQWKNKLLLTDGDDFCLKKLIVEIEEVEEDIT